MRANLSFPQALSHGNRDVWGAGGAGEMVSRKTEKHRHLGWLKGALSKCPAHPWRGGNRCCSQLLTRAGEAWKVKAEEGPDGQ